MTLWSNQQLRVLTCLTAISCSPGQTAENGEAAPSTSVSEMPAPSTGALDPAVGSTPDEALLPAEPGQASLPQPVEPAACELFRFSVTPPPPPIDYMVTVSLDEERPLGVQRARELIDAIGTSMRQPGNRDLLYLFVSFDLDIDALLYADGLLDGLESRTRVSHRQYAVPGMVKDPDPIDYAMGTAMRLSRAHGEGLVARPNASVQAISVLAEEGDELLCWTSAVPRREPCESLEERQQATAERLDEATHVGWQAHLLRPDGCDGVSADLPLMEGIVERSGGLDRNYCEPDAVEVFLDDLQSQLNVPYESCEVALPEEATRAALEAEQLRVFASLSEGEALSEIRRGGEGCEGYEVDRLLSPSSVRLCGGFCRGAEVALEVEVGCSTCDRLNASIDSGDARGGALDLVIGIDASPSMGQETELVHLNIDRFAQIVSDLGVDIRLIFLANGELRPPAGLLSREGQFVSLDIEIGSVDALDVLEESYEIYAPHLRPDTPTHFLVITDDDTTYLDPDVTTPASELPEATSFVARMSELLGREFVYHSIASPGEEPERCRGPHGSAARPARVQLGVTELTGGTQQSICTPDWGPLFLSLAKALLIDIPRSCEFDLPPPPEGTDYTAESVEVQLAVREDPTIYTVPSASSAASCSGDGGWYFDNPDRPTQVLLCPATCEFVATSLLPAIQVSFNCEIPEPIPPPVIPR